MRARGITFDTGFVHAGHTTRVVFDPAVVEREMRVIRDDLHCTAVRVTGGDPARLELAATLAMRAGLEVWFSPFTSDLTQDELVAVLVDCAERAERLRRAGADIVFVAGAELMLFTKGFLPGAELEERLGLLARPERFREALPQVPGRLNAFFARAVPEIRARFGGKVTYAAIPSERIDWTPFDIVGVDAYRSAAIAGIYAQGIRSLVAQGKPVAITEFGCVTCRGAGDLGGSALDLVEWGRDGTPLRLKGELVRDESEQVRYLNELLDLFEAEGVDAAFWCTFASYNQPQREPPGEDFDMASYGVVRVLEKGSGAAYPGMPWEPKAGFRAMAERYGAAATRPREGV